MLYLPPETSFITTMVATYVWNHMYWDQQANTYGLPPVSNRPGSQVLRVTDAVLIWEIPYHDYRYMPHEKRHERRPRG